MNAALDKLIRSPLRLIETILAVTSLGTAAYFFSPLYAIGKTVHQTPLNVILVSPYMWWAWAAVLAIGSIVVLVGLYKDNRDLRSAGLFMLFLPRLYQVIAIFIVAGPIPLQWLPPLTIAVICLVLRAALRWRPWQYM